MNKFAQQLTKVAYENMTLSTGMTKQALFGTFVGAGAGYDPETKSMEGIVPGTLAGSALDLAGYGVGAGSLYGAGRVLNSKGTIARVADLVDEGLPASTAIRKTIGEASIPRRVGAGALGLLGLASIVGAPEYLAYRAGKSFRPSRVAEE